MPVSDTDYSPFYAVCTRPCRRSWPRRVAAYTKGDGNMSQRTSIDYLSQTFLTYCRVEGRTEKTVAWHTTALTKLARYLTANGLEDVSTVTRDNLRGYVAHLQASTGRGGGPMSAHSVATYVRSMRAFFHWLVEEEYLDSNPAQKVREPKAGERDIQTLTLAEVKLLAAVCTGTQGLRDKALILTLYDTGLRASEITNATLEAFTESPASLRVYGKGRKFRTVPIGRTTTKEIRRYLRGRKDDSPYLFVGRNGDKLTANSLGQLLTRRGKAAGVVHCNPHLFRHTFAITYLRYGGDVLSLQRILGHSSLDMVRHYARLADSDVMESHKRYSPSDRLR